MELQIVYEDNHCFVVNKPSNLLVHHSHFARNIEETSLVDLVRLQLEMPEASPVHRLDRKTSGLLLFVKQVEFAPAFNALFDEQQIQKTYWALMRGHLPENGSVESPVKNERGNYREALTHYRCLKQVERDFDIPPYPQQRYSLVELEPKTGRYHQLRIHANKIGHPIINDPKHGNRHHNHYFEEVLGISELFLHARKLTFTHPYTEERCALEAELPAFWTDFFTASEWNEIRFL